VAHFNKSSFFIEPAVPNSADIHSARILIVNNCRDTGGVLCEGLRLMGYGNVSFATDGKSLSDVNTAIHYSLILLDMHIPSLDGLEIMCHLRSNQTAYSVQ